MTNRVKKSQAEASDERGQGVQDRSCVLVETGRTHGGWTLAHGAPREPGLRTLLQPWPALQGRAHRITAFSLASTTSRPLLDQKGKQVRPHWGLRGKELGAKGMDTKDEGDSGGEMGEQGDGEASKAREDAEPSKPQGRGTCKQLRRSRDV